MAWGNFVLDKGFEVAAAVTKYRFVKLSAAETVTPVTAVADDPIGVAQFGVTASERTDKGKGTTVRVLGVTEVEAGGAIAVGDRCELMSDGRVRIVTTASGARVVGKCVGHPSSAAGERIAMLIFHGGGTA